MRRTLRDLFVLSVVFGLVSVAAVGWKRIADKGLEKTIVSAVQSIPILEDSVQQVIGSVVHIVNETQDLQGSGFILTPDIVVTARHVAEWGDSFVVTLNDGTKIRSHRALTSKKYDVGFLQLEKAVYTTGVKLGSIADCRLGQQVFAIGSPFGEVNFNSMTLGVISSLKRELEKYDCPKDMGWSVTFQTDAAGHPGNSGCPVFTTDGVVRGILVGGFSNALIYCVPVDLFMGDLETIKALFAQDKYQFEEGFVPRVTVTEDY